MKNWILTLQHFISPPEGHDRLKYFRYKIFEKGGSYRLKVRRFPLGMWANPSSVLSNHGLEYGYTNSDNIYQSITNEASDEAQFEKSLSTFAELMSRYKKPKNREIDKGSIFEFKVLDSL